MDIITIPDILKNAKPEAEQPWTLFRMAELLKAAYAFADHPVLKAWRGHDPVDIFQIDPDNLTKAQLFNRTRIERTIHQAEYFGQLGSKRGQLITRSKGIEHSVFSVEYFATVANKLYETSEEELQRLGAGVHHFRYSGTGQLSASILYFLDTCNNLIALTYKHVTGDKLKTESDDAAKVKYLLRQKTDLLQQEDQFDKKVFATIKTFLEIELNHYKEMNEFLEMPLEIKKILDQFLAERKARITSNQLLGFLLEEKYNDFCKCLSELVFQLFSYYDLGGSEPERVYHYFLLGLFSAFKEYRIESNRESGTGRFDILLIPDTLEDKGIIIEVKRAMKNDSNYITTLLNDALVQLVDNKYAVELKIRGHKEYVGIAAVFYGKQLQLKYAHLPC